MTLISLLRAVPLFILLTAFSSGAVLANSVFIPLGEADRIAEVDPVTLKIIKMIGPVSNPHGLAITPDGRFLYAGSISEEAAQGNAVMEKLGGVSDEEHRRHHGISNDAPPSEARSISFISRINTRSGEVERRIDVEKFTHHIAVTPDGARVIGVQSGAARIAVIDGQSDRVLRYVRVGQTPNYALISRTGDQVFVSNAGSNSITVLNRLNWNTIATIPVGKGPEHMAFSANEEIIYVVNTGSRELSLVDVASLKVIKTVPTGNNPHGVAFNTFSNTVIVSNNGSGSLSVYSGDGNLLQEVLLAPQPYHVAGGPEGSIWISSRKQGIIWLLSEEDFTIKKTLEIPGIGHQIAFAP